MTREEEIDLAWAQHQPRFEHGVKKSWELRLRLAEAQNWRCCYCGVVMSDRRKDPKFMTFEHVIPRSKGGSTQEANLVMACSTCNHARGDNTDMIEQIGLIWISRVTHTIGGLL